MVAGRPCSSAFEDDVRHARQRLTLLTMARCQLNRGKRGSTSVHVLTVYHCCRVFVPCSAALPLMHWCLDTPFEIGRKICPTAPHTRVPVSELWISHGIPRGLVSSDLSMIYVDPAVACCETGSKIIAWISLAPARGASAKFFQTRGTQFQCKCMLQMGRYPAIPSHVPRCPRYRFFSSAAILVRRVHKTAAAHPTSPAGPNPTVNLGRSIRY